MIFWRRALGVFVFTTDLMTRHEYVNSGLEV